MRPGYYNQFPRTNHVRITVWLSVVLFFLLLIAYEKVHSQSCNHRIEPVDNWQIKYRERGNRCEGFYRSKVSGEAIEVVGVIIDKLQFKLKKDEILEITSPVVKNGLVHVRAVGIPIKTYYRMDTQIGAGEKFIWPIKDVIYPQKLTAAKIGLFGWVGQETKKTFVPIRVVAKLEAGAGNEAIWMLFRTSVDVETVKWRCADMTNGVPSQLGKWLDTPNQYYRPGQPITVLLPTSKTGELFVEVAARELSSGQWLKRSAHVIVEQKHGN